MKRIMFLIIAGMGFGLTNVAMSSPASVVGTQWQGNHNVQVVHLYELKKEQLNHIMEGKLPHLAVKFSENTMLPVDVYVKGDLVNLLSDTKNIGQVIQVKQPFYVRCIDGDLFMSSDLSKWTPFLEFITGELKVALSLTEDGAPTLVIGSETNKRTS